MAKQNVLVEERKKLLHEFFSEKKSTSFQEDNTKHEHDVSTTSDTSGGASGGTSGVGGQSGTGGTGGTGGSDDEVEGASFGSGDNKVEVFGLEDLRQLLEQYGLVLEEKEETNGVGGDQVGGDEKKKKLDRDL
eukprot:TRINITY_DN9290_c0_g1_i5.p1 TRINITY_DN9290_c0_g1~~TRINITY_DN9290_c0_g1_i5.p1  ORF type:complete len:133 (-),score=62.89 TRINITY_DN9290_c0_g1_i5:121-519(-)